MTRFFLWLMPLMVLVSGCKDEAERIPAYIQVAPFVVNAQGGAGWQKITEAWVYVNNDLLGGYSLPATIPVLAEGENQILVFPGVRENGLAETPVVYPFMTRYETKKTLVPGETLAIQPVTAYSPDAIFPWSVERASFNNSSIVLENRDGDTATTFVLTTEGAFDGRSVKLAVDTAHTLIEIATEQLSGLPLTQAQPVWLEMHYRNDIPFELWLLGSQGSGSEQAQPIYQFAPTDQWNKIYFNLTGFLITLQQQKYRLFFRASLPKTAAGKYEKNNGQVLFDNLRLIHY